MDLELARFNMIEQQIRPWDVLDDTVLGLLARVKREEFVPAAYRNMALMDIEIPLGHGETMWSPKLEARLLQELQLQPDDKVLEVGTGSAYLTALLASLAKHVHSVDIVPEFVESARRKLDAHGFQNVTLEAGDAALGWAVHAPYDAIILTGSEPVLAEAFVKQLKPGGRLIAVVGTAPVMTARRIEVTAAGIASTTDLFETEVRALAHAPQPAAFVF